MKHTWKDRAGSLVLGAVVHVRSSGSHDDAKPDSEAEHVEEREIVDVEIGNVTFSASSTPIVFHALVELIQEDVDGSTEDDFSWEDAK